MILPFILSALLAASQTVPTVVVPIYNEVDLKNIKSCLSCQYVLLANLSLSSPWAPLGTMAVPFTGSLDGQGNTITFNGFTASDSSKAGLFNSMVNATVTNLNLLSTASGDVSQAAGSYVFGLVAALATNVTAFGCSAVLVAKIDIPRGSLTLGGLFGSVTNSSVATSFANVTINVAGVTTLFLGALAGNSVKTRIRTCEAHVQHTVLGGRSVTMGGFIGVCQSSVIDRSTISGNVTSHAESTSEILGGFIGLSIAGQGGCVAQSIMATVNIESSTSTNAAIGGIIGSAKGVFIMRNCDVLFSLDGISKGVSVGGMVGNATGTMLSITSCRVNATFFLNIQEAARKKTYAGGLVGYTATRTTISNALAIVTVSITSPNPVIGGLVGLGIQLNILESGAMGSITTLSSEPGTMVIGGLVGIAESSSLSRCHFIGEFTTDLSEFVEVGAIAAMLTNTQMLFTYALANITTAAANITTGAVAIATESAVTASYAAVRIEADASMVLTVGGMIGSMQSGSSAQSSFVIVNISCLGSAEEGAIGGFVGTADAFNAEITISDCYVWGSVTSSVTGGSMMSLGGFAGNLFNSIAVSNCLAYADISSSTPSTIAGLLAGRAKPHDPIDSSVKGTVKLTIVYVVPGGKLADVKLIGDVPDATITTSFCASYTGTAECTPIDTLNTASFLKQFDLESTFRLDVSVANGSLAFQTLPMPPSGATIASPQLILPDGGLSDSWSHESWDVRSELQLGYPFLLFSHYDSYCRPSLGCHGYGTSPVDAVCSSGWSSPPRNSQKLVSDLSMCNIFLCTNDNACSLRGICEAGKCQCDAGFAGPDCSIEICPEVFGFPCGFNTCRRFSDTSVTGICKCASTEYLTPEGFCMPGCLAVGAGICRGLNNLSCFEGYSPESGCFVYDCSVPKTGACNGKGTCTDKKCVCNQGSINLDGNCYTQCSTSATGSCISISCGDGNSCLGLGLCAPSLSGRDAMCACNVDASGRVTSAHLGGPICQDCELGYRKFRDSCVPDKCLVCLGGECVYDEESNSFRCKCKDGRVTVLGVCYDDLCDNCPTGLCRAIPNGLSPLERYCLCRTGLPEETCYGYSCGSCKGGSCIPDNSTMTISCACPEKTVFNATSGDCDAEPVVTREGNLAIILPVVFTVLAVAAAITAAVVIVKKRKARRVPINDSVEIREKSLTLADV